MRHDMEADPAMTAPIARSPNAVDYGLLFLLGVLWGGSFFLIKIGVATVPPMTLTAARLLIAALVMLVIAAVMGERLPVGRRIWALIALSGLIGNALPFFLISWGEEKIDSGLAAILMALMPLSTVLLAHVLIREDRMTLGKLAGVLLGLAGVVVLIGPAKLATLGDSTIRQLAVAGAALCYSLNTVVTRFMVGQPRHALVAGVMLASAVYAVPASLLHDDLSALTPSAASIWSIMVLAVVQTALGTVLMLMIVARQGATFFAQINFIVPLTGVAWGFIVLREVPAPAAVLALGLILAGIAIARARIQSRTNAR
jgi:drug/metabolite transporter (DMT)-like permease